MSQRYVLSYTILFAIMFTLCYGWYWLYGRTFLWAGDGLEQWYAFFAYAGEWQRKVLHSIFIEHKLSIPMWEMSLGYGSDIIASIGWELADPLNWISFLFKKEQLELALDCTIIIKYYLSGLAFIAFARYKGYKNFTCLFGAISYAFMGCLIIGVFQALFLPPYYVFPIVMLGVEKFWKERKPLIYILSMAFMLFTYFYNAYMMLLFVGIECVIYWFVEYNGKKDAKSFASWVGAFALATMMSIGIAAVMLLPIMNQFLGQDRIKSDFYIPWIFSLGYYKTAIINFANYGDFGRDDRYGFGFFSVFAVLFLIFKRKEYKRDYIRLIVFAVVLFIPYINRIFNGFAYTANRWIFIMGLFMINACCMALENIVEDFHTNRFKYLTVIGIYICLIAIDSKYPGSVSTVLFMALACLLFFLSDKNGLYFQLLALALVMISSFATNYVAFNKDYYNLTGINAERGTSYKYTAIYKESKLLDDINFKEGYRFDAVDSIPRQPNMNWVGEYYGFNRYSTLYNPLVDKFIVSTGVMKAPYPQRDGNLDKETVLENIFGVKYYLWDKDNITAPPYGFDTFEKEGVINGINKSTNTVLLSREDALPMIFGYNRSFSESYFESVPMFERVNLLRKGVVLSNGSEPGSLQNNHEINYKMEFPDTVTKEGNVYKVTADRSIVKLRFDNIKDSEVYVGLKGMRNLPANRPKLFGFMFELVAMKGDENVLSAGNLFDMTTGRGHMYSGREDRLVNLGYVNETIDGIALQFDQAGEYQIDEIKINALPKTELDSIGRDLNQIASNINIQGNVLQADVDLQKDQYIYIAVPYSKGWKATLNDAPVEIERANVAFMAIKAPKGKYALKMHFTTPYLKEGAMISLFSLLLVLGYWLYDRRNRHFVPGRK